jgi:hypothetical protein
MRIMEDMKSLVMNTIQEIQTIEDINMLLSSGLTDIFNIPTSKPSSPKQHPTPAIQHFPT